MVCTKLINFGKEFFEKIFGKTFDFGKGVWGKTFYTWTKEIEKSCIYGGFVVHYYYNTNNSYYYYYYYYSDFLGVF